MCGPDRNTRSMSAGSWRDQLAEGRENVRLCDGACT
jgi:hypothetical protein